MEKINFPRRFRVYLPLIALFLLLVFLMPRSSRFSYDYRKGSPWQYETLVAQFDFPLLKTETRYQSEVEQAWSNVIPYYRQDDNVRRKALSSISSMDFGLFSSAKPAVSEAVSAVYSKGILPSSSDSDADGSMQSSDGMIYIQKNRRAVKIPVSEVFTIETAAELLVDALSESCPECSADSLYDAIGLGDLIMPDLVFDQQTTDLVHEDNSGNVSRTEGVVRAGFVLVSNGEIVTSEIEQLLDSYKAEYDENIGYAGPVFLQWMGNIAISFFLVLLLFLAIYYSNSKVFEEYNKYLYLLMIFLLSAVGTIWVSESDPALFYMMPFMLVVFYQLAFFSRRIVFSVFFISLLPMLLLAPDGMELFVIYLVAGSVGILTFEYFNKGWLQFVNALIVFIVMALVWVAFRFADGISFADYGTLLKMVLGVLLSVAGYPLIYLFEKIFKLVSSSKLVELSDTSQPLLRMLADKAPGTFQHSLQVMNLADAVARSIDANVPLVRAAALYHDIGKINNPQCFTENETPGIRYHAGLTPKESAEEIIRHVQDGIVLAEKYSLPDVLKDFINTHHGTTSTAYFLNQYLNQGGDPDDVDAFRYDGVKPTGKEQVILMFCDAVEAASRSLKDYSAENISSLVEKIVDGKISEGQLTDSDITLREITAVKEVMKTYIQRMYHSRVAYPKRKPKEASSDILKSR